MRYFIHFSAFTVYTYITQADTHMYMCIYICIYVSCTEKLADLLRVGEISQQVGTAAVKFVLKAVVGHFPAPLFGGRAACCSRPSTVGPTDEPP